MLQFFGLLLGTGSCVTGLVIVVVTMRNQGWEWHNVGTSVAAAVVGVYGLLVMALGAWLMLWAAGLT